MDDKPNPELVPDEHPEPGLFKRYPKLGVLLIAAVAYLILIGMCLVVLVLLIRAV